MHVFADISQSGDGHSSKVFTYVDQSGNSHTFDIPSRDISQSGN
ncbi:hypothetical protein [uncultured Bacteroides sp.]